MNVDFTFTSFTKNEFDTIFLKFLRRINAKVPEVSLPRGPLLKWQLPTLPQYAVPSA